MALKLIDMETWERREFYEHFINEVVCTYSAVVNIDITNLKGQKLYPAMIWLLTKTVNDMPEFRTVLTPDGPGIYDDMHPMYTVFNKENKNFSGISHLVGHTTTRITENNYLRVQNEICQDALDRFDQRFGFGS